MSRSNKAWTLDLTAYIINLPNAAERREHMREVFKELPVKAVFVEAIAGNEIYLPAKGYRQWAYRLAHGKRTNLAELGCYFSHIKAITQFLDSNDSHALILEDDVEFNEDFAQALHLALKHSERFDMLRLSGLHRGTPARIIKLNERYNLSIFFSRQTGAGAYLINRKAAEKLAKHLLPMWLPFDHAFDREWLWGLNTLCIDPLPITQNEKFETQIAADRNYKYSSYIRYFSVLPFRTFNELSRLAGRTFSFIKQKLHS